MPVDPKIIDIISKEKEGPYVSLEYFPPRSAEGVKVRLSSKNVPSHHDTRVVPHTPHTTTCFAN